MIEVIGILKNWILGLISRINYLIYYFLIFNQLIIEESGYGIVLIVIIIIGRAF